MAACADATSLVEIPPSLMRGDLERREPQTRKFIDLAGQSFDHFMVIGLAGFLKKYAAWLCRCECGCLFVARGNMLSKRTAGCGCGSSRHGMSGHPLFRVWVGMKQRCHNPNNPAYEHYGARGISVCERWRDDFSLFLADMGDRPSKKHSLDRIDNNGNYDPVNCRWATMREQARNTRKNRWIEANGERLLMTDWAARTGLTRERIRQRVNKCIRLGADTAEAVTTPPGERMPCTLNRGSWCDTYPEGAPEKVKAPARAKLREALSPLLDGNVHHLTAEQADALCPRGFFKQIRHHCERLGLKATTRQLGDHILFRADAREA